MMTDVRGESLTSARRLRAQERQKAAWQLRLAGAMYADIAQQLGYNSPDAAFRGVAAYRKRIHKADSEVERGLLLERLNRLLLSAWQEALGHPGTRGDPKARAFVLDVLREVSKIMGLYAPVKVDMAMVRREAEKIAGQSGLTVDEVLAEAEAIVAGR